MSGIVVEGSQIISMPSGTTSVFEIDTRGGHAEVVSNLSPDGSLPKLKIYLACRWHHDRYNAEGDGLGLASLEVGIMSIEREVVEKFISRYRSNGIGKAFQLVEVEDGESWPQL